MSKIDDARQILQDLNLPRAQQNDRTALCFLALTDVLENTEWKDAKNPLVGITPMMEFADRNYERKYAPNSRETFRRFSMHQLVQAGIALYNPDDINRPVNSPKAVYQISEEALKVVRAFGQIDYQEKMNNFLLKRPSLAEVFRKRRKLAEVSISLHEDLKVQLSPGSHSELIRLIIEVMMPQFIPGSDVLYIGDTGDKWGYFNAQLSKQIGLEFDHHGKMPDVILYHKNKGWLVLVESVTTHGPVDGTRYLELAEMFRESSFPLVYISAFMDKRTYCRYASEIAWETEVWISEEPTHMIHLNGSKFIGPYSS